MDYMMTSNKVFIVKISIIILTMKIMLMGAKANLTNDFIVDYFNYKKPSSVIGYTCNNMTDDVILMKYLSNNGYTTLLNKLTDKSDSFLLTSVKYYKVGIFVDTRCYDPNDIATFYLNATNMRYYGELQFWLVLGENLTDILSDVNEEAFGLSTDFVVAVSTSLEQFELYDVYNQYKTRDCEMNVTFFGDWNSLNRLSLELLQIKPVRRSNLHAIKLKVMYYQALYKPKNMSLTDYFHEYRDITRDARLKFGFFILSHLSELLNFTIEYVQAGKWAHGDGLGPTVRALMNSAIDLTGTPGNMNVERLRLVKFVHQGWPFRTCFILRNPQPKTIKAEEILRPFVHEVWHLMGLFLLISMVILSLTLKSDCPDNNLRKLSNSFTIILGAVSQQGTDIKMPRLSSRIAFFFILIFSLVMYDYYSASVVSARLDEPIFKINDSLDALGKLNMKMASERMFYLSFYFASPDKETKKFHEEYWFKIPEKEQFMDPEVAIELVRKGELAYHVHPDVAYVLIEKYYNNREICELKEVHWGRPIDTMFATTKNCTFEEILKIGFIKISEVGLRYRQIKRWQYRRPICRRDVLSASSINMYEFATHLILLAAGTLLALIVFGLEVMIFKVKIVIPTDFCEESKSSFWYYEAIMP